MAGVLNLQEQAEQVLAKAEQKGVQTNFFFVTTFKRYQVQMKILTDLEQSIRAMGMTVTKEYVKGRENVCINPTITEYNKTATAANNTVATLMKIITALPEEETKGGRLESLIEALNE